MPATVRVHTPCTIIRMQPTTTEDGSVTAMLLSPKELIQYEKPAGMETSVLNTGPAYTAVMAVCPCANRPSASTAARSPRQLPAQLKRVSGVLFLVQFLLLGKDSMNYGYSKSVWMHTHSEIPDLHLTVSLICTSRAFESLWYTATQHSPSRSSMLVPRSCGLGNVIDMTMRQT